MTPNHLLREIETLSPAQLESVYSFVYLLKHPNYLYVTQGSPKKNIEPFTSEQEAIDFANHYSGITLNEAW